MGFGQANINNPKESTWLSNWQINLIITQSCYCFGACTWKRWTKQVKHAEAKDLFLSSLPLPLTFILSFSFAFRGCLLHAECKSLVDWISKHCIYCGFGSSYIHIYKSVHKYTYLHIKKNTTFYINNARWLWYIFYYIYRKNVFQD